MKNHVFRYAKGVVSPFSISLVSIRNPNLAMWWGAAFPGLPQIAMCKYISGVILIAWEFIINTYSNLNVAIIYSFTGRFELAQEVLDTRWFLLYIPVYIFGIWDGRRVVMDVNKHALLADMTGSVKQINPVSVAWYENNILERRKPAIAAMWSFILPGLGHLYTHRIPTAFFILFCTSVTIYFANILPAIHLTFLGNFHEATNILNPQWVLFYPSIFCFSMVDAYLFCEKSNKLFKAQQAIYFNDNTQPHAIKTNLLTKRVTEMNVIASFSYSMYVELAIKELKQNDINDDSIFVIPLTETKQKKNIDIIRGGEDINLFEASVATATAFSVLGTIYGFIWTGGPVIWGLIGLFSGAILGFIIDYLIKKQKIKRKHKKGNGGEIMVIIHCSQEKVQMVKNILFDHFTLGVSVVDMNSEKKTVNTDNSSNDLLS
ncbi:hypothetical protein [Halalkalibacter alkaliphilus]|uniref:Uncharacterized protein n=1 Tax=Halalkalibacter alkaliphilus TaxID=2917993 RepID=A0A9X2CUY4_9BACI|nr:hypothetical protein [Halalkalibacter alkaliphilus]MCL7748364.1 hypothetical protein [Halalkalibacter alkaliphilus]